MNRRLIVGSLVAFCVALGVGRLFFAPQDPAVEALDTAASNPASALPETPAPAVPVAAAAGGKTLTETTRVINREWKRVNGGIENVNIHQVNVLGAVYTDGIVHRAPNNFNASFAWTPEARDLRRGQSVIAKLDRPAPVPGQIEKNGHDSSVVYNGTFQDTFERITVRPTGGIEHDIVLGKVPANMDTGMGLAYTGRLKLSKGLTIWEENGQEITGSFKTMKGLQIKNNRGNTVFFVRPPIAWDAAVTLEDGSLDKEKQGLPEHRARAVHCEYHLERDESGWTFAVVTPGQWLLDSRREYPVTIDPNVGPFNLADDRPPFYVAVVGSGSALPAYAGGTMVPLFPRCNRSADDNVGAIAMPFNFNFYGINIPTGSTLFVYENGYANFQTPIPFPSPFYPGGCNAETNFPLGSNGGDIAGIRNFTFYPYWDDLAVGTDQNSGIYFFVDGDPATGTRRLVIEWHKMKFKRQDSQARISFNLILEECESKFQYIIGLNDEKDLGNCTVGVRETLRPSMGRYIQYDYNSSQNDPTPDPNDPNANNNQISPGTSLNFQVSQLNNVVVTPKGPLDACVPHVVCFDVTVTAPPVATCVTVKPFPPTTAYVWTWGDDSFSFTGPLARPDGLSTTQTICHTWVTPGVRNPTLVITDEFGASATVGDFDVNTCDVPDVVIGATPQGGYAPLDVSFFAQSINANVGMQFSNTGTVNPEWTVYRYDPASMGAAPVPVIADQPSTSVNTNGEFALWNFRFDLPGVYRVDAAFTGTDITTGDPTTGVGRIFIFVASPDNSIEDALVITDSKMTIDWIGKQDGPDADGYAPNTNSTNIGDGPPDNPENDTLYIRGFISLPGQTLSSLTGRRVRVNLNGSVSIFSGVFDASGTAVQGNPETGITGEFRVDLPSGAFIMKVKRDLATSLGLINETTRLLLPALFQVDIPGLFPPPGFDGAIITYDYQSQVYQSGPPEVGSAIGIYRFGHDIKGTASNGGVNGSPFDRPLAGLPGGQTLLISGAFLVTDAKVKLNGGFVYYDLKGMLARYGGDSLQPRDSSDVLVRLGTFSEPLNFTTTGGFKAKGRAPSQTFSFKRPKALGKTGIASFQYRNRAGYFSLKTHGIPVELTGLNPALDRQILDLGLTITPDASQIYTGNSRFEVTKTKTNEFTRKAKLKK